ncbi:MAG: phosphatidylglycerol lysyltransferase domain-containing protein [Elusimicrobiota bacterium]|jgi:hypothetical protein
MQFELLGAQHYPRLKAFFVGQRLELSTYSLPSLVVWSQCVFDTMFAVVEDAVLFAERRMDDPERRHLLLPVSASGFKDPDWLRQRAIEAGYKEYHFVPRSYLDFFGQSAVEEYFTVQPHAGYDDYVYRAADLGGLAGRDYAKKRNLVRQFERGYGGVGRVAVSSITPANAEECISCLQGWRSERPGKDWTEVLECERQAITKALHGLVELEFQGVMVSVDGMVRGFAIGSRLRADTWVLNFEKASDEVKGLYQYLDRESARRLFPGVAFLNKESDLGDPGLAQAKQSYHPQSRAYSHRLALRP